jgi:phosphoribosylanthranilate isomerase
MSLRRLFVKICGITTQQDARVAVEAGADAIGFVFWLGSARCVEVDVAREIGAGLPASVVRVGVFVGASGEEMQRTAEAAHLDLLQLHGDEQPETLPALCRPAWKALRVGSAPPPPRELRRWAGRVSGILLDTQSASAPGGSGESFDWSLARGAREHVGFLMLAGGLRADNVRHAIEIAQPDGVDVSSGVEASPGRKDEAKVRAFVAAVRGAA